MAEWNRLMYVVLGAFPPGTVITQTDTNFIAALVIQQCLSEHGQVLHLTCLQVFIPTTTSVYKIMELRQNGRPQRIGTQACAGIHSK